MHSAVLTRAARRGRAVAGAALAAGLVLSLTGCGGDSAGSGGSAASSGGSAAAAGGQSLGLIAFDMTSASDAAFDNSTNKAFTDAGWEVLTQDPKGDPGQANTICSQYVTRQVTALVVTTFAQDQMAQCLSQASAAKIPVFFLASPLLDGMAGAVDVVAPEPINDAFVTYLKDNAVTNILTLDYTPGTPCRLRAEYRDKAIADAGLDITVDNHEFPIPGQVVDSQNATAAWLSAHPAGSGTFAIWSCFADSTAGALAGIQQAGRTDALPVFTWDYSVSIVNGIRSGAVAADLWLDFDGVGAQALQLVTDYLKDGKPAGATAANIVLTKDNIEKFLADHPEVERN
ncbi:substrate-binding domain-containing protein [Nakamurella flavida]|uniref:Substrate-binding domain-containing protein n=1 Tax=Nakamurella flavida TaxID=363630 RepID=A0A939C2L9_9ACTN|nr:substrate-binding domain-containing protein [Nakamurella flavida]MBM9476146.1 substrate-binding domain-containing protein [Nakamurella flavida]MDP9777109.1 ABC-type sugar transport system substrate-binding protein [Nakamurella flavida]